MNFNKYMKVPRARIFGAPVFVHWSTLVVTLLLLTSNSLVNGLVATAAYFSLLLLHEAGHAWFAKRQRLRRIAIRLSGIHGVCEYEEPYYAEQDYKVAWGGVFAQLVVAVPIVLADVLFGLRQVEPFGPVVAILGYVSLGIAAFNLIPVGELDGARAWKLVAMSIERRRARSFRPRRSR